MKGEFADTGEGGDETSVILHDEELMNEIRQGLELLEKDKAGYCTIEEP